MINLKTFLAKHSSNTITNVTSLDSKWGGKWFIPRENYHEFLELYYKEILNNNYKFVEKKVDNNEIFRMFADIDISKDDIKTYFQQELPDNLMSSIVEIYKNVISELFIIDTTHINPIISCRANQPSKCHLQWPNLIVNNTYGKIIREKVLTLIKSSYSGDWEKWIDKASYTCTGLRMLGSLKMHERKTDRYYVITAFNEKNLPQNLQSLSLDSIKNTSIRVLSDNEQITELSNAGKECLQSYNSNKIVVKAVKHIDNNSLTVPTDIINDMRTVTYDIPPLTKQYIERAFMNSWTTANYSPEILESFSIGKIIMVEDYYTMLNQKKMLCPIKRDFHKRECGCNYHVMGPDGTYIKCYDEACKGKRFPEIAIPLEPEVKQFLYVNNITINNNITNNNNGIISTKPGSSAELNFMEDINKISIFSDEKKDKILLKSLNGGEASMAYLLHSCFHDKLHYSKSDGWWYWTGSVWRLEYGDIIHLLYNEIGDKLLKKVRDKYDQLDDKMFNDNHTNKKNIKDAKLYQIDTIIKKLETKEYKSKIISEAEWVFAQNSKIRITQLLDTNPYLIGFINGVYDLQKMEFRKIEYNDLVYF